MRNVASSKDVCNRLDRLHCNCVSCHILQNKMALALLIVFPLLAGCVQLPSKPNQRSPLVSPSGKYVLTVPLEQNPRRGNHTYWTVTISDSEKEALFKDDSDFVALLNVYWCWDSEDRVWLFNSDTGTVYFWEKFDNGWRKVEWGYGKTKQIAREIIPPKELYPSYVK